YKEGELDFAGTCVGYVDADDLVDGSRCERGDAIIGFPSNGLHTNGFTLVRELVGDDDFDADLMLAPHRLYLNDIRELRPRADIRALAHIPGGGLRGNLNRVLPDQLRANVDWNAWERPPVYEWLAERGVTEGEARAVFNLGIGLCAIVPTPP